MDAEEREVFRELTRQVEGVVGGVNGLVGGVNRFVDGVRVMGETLASQMEALTTQMHAMREELRETRVVLSEGQQATQAELRTHVGRHPRADRPDRRDHPRTRQRRSHAMTTLVRPDARVLLGGANDVSRAAGADRPLQGGVRRGGAGPGGDRPRGAGLASRAG